MARIGYARATTDVDYLATQRKALEAYKCDAIYIEQYLEKKITYNTLTSVINELKENDQLVIYRLDCLGKHIVQLPDITEKLQEKGVHLSILNNDVHSDNVPDNLVYQLIEMGAELERSLIRENTIRGLNEARKEGRVGGRPVIPKKVIDKVIKLYKSNHTLRQIASETQISIGATHKYIQQYKESLKEQENDVEDENE